MTLPLGLYEYIQRLFGLDATVARLSPHCADLAGATALELLYIASPAPGRVQERVRGTSVSH